MFERFLEVYSKYCLNLLSKLTNKECLKQSFLTAYCILCIRLHPCLKSVFPFVHLEKSSNVIEKESKQTIAEVMKPVSIFFDVFNPRFFRLLWSVEGDDDNLISGTR